jgi:hypothetical protein
VGRYRSDLQAIYVGQDPAIISSVEDAPKLAATDDPDQSELHPRSDLLRWDRLSRMHMRESQVIALLATKMRLTHTQRHRIEKRTPMTTGTRPWEA